MMLKTDRLCIRVSSDAEMRFLATGESGEEGPLFALSKNNLAR